MSSLVHVTFYATSKIRDQELTRFAATLPDDSSITVNSSTGIVKVSGLTTIHLTLENPRERLIGVGINGYTFHNSIKQVSTDLVHWLNEEVSKNARR